MRLLEALRDDARLAWRAMRRTPLVAAVIVLSLGAGIGANTVVFSWIQACMIRPLPGVVDSAGFHLVTARTKQGLYTESSWREFLDLADQPQTMRDLLAYRMAPLYVGETGAVERIYGQLVSGQFFEALGVRPAKGRFFRVDEASTPGREPVAVISHGLWQRRFGGDAAVIGRAVRVNGATLTVIGVTPDEFQGTVSGLNFDMWLPATIAPAIAPGTRELEDRGVRGYSILGRLRPPATREQAQHEIDGMMRRLAEAYPSDNAAIAAEVLPFWNSPRGPQRLLNYALAMLQGAMLLLLLAICGNTANLVLARASTRQREVGVRLALGAARWRIVRLLLTENVLLALCGAGLGAILATWGTRALQLLPITSFPLRIQTSVDAQGLLFASMLGVGCGLLVGAAAAAHLARVDPQQALRAGAKSAGRSAWRHTLMAAQTALALVVLIVAGLFLRSFLDTRRIDPGFRRDGVLLAAYDFSGRGASQDRARTFADTLLQRLRARPGIEQAALAASIPLDIHGLPNRPFAIEGRPGTTESPDRVSSNVVSPGYFALMGIALRSGADFADLGDASTAPQAIVNEAFARTWLDGLEPLGQRLQSRGRLYTIVGVVATTVSNAFGEPPTPVVYFSYRDNPSPLGEIHLRARRGAESALASEVRGVVAALDPELPVFNVRTLHDHVETNLIFRRIPARMFAVLGPLLLALASIGIYAVVAYTVSQRTMEIGLRLAIGATGPRLVAQLMGESLRVVAAGAAIGWLVGLVIALEIAGAPSIDPLVFIGIPALLLSVAAVACWQPAHRAASISPTTALRQD